MTCKKCGTDNWGTWISSSTSKLHVYCKTCRRDRANAYSQRRAKAPGTHTTSQWLAKLKEHDKCPACNRLWKSIPHRPDKRYRYVWTKDHIVPLSRGGTDSIENIQPLCYQCNFGKR
ncbi:HNH endonuclease [Fibrella aestuarina]|uniref:HNH endonuclease n=1 Tax=Fibrella aestuarina TaxID=651143 RepID=UPI000A048AEE